MKASTVVVVWLGCLNTLVAASLRLPSHSAARILKLRGGVTLAALQKDMQTALLTEDFEWAAEIKAKICKMSSEPQIATAATPTTRVSPGNVAALEEEIRIAVLCEDFQRAKELKNQIDEATQAKTSAPPSPATRNYDDVKAEINAARSAADNARFTASTEETKDATAAAAVETNTAPSIENDEKDSAQASVAPSAAPASSPLNPLSDDLLNAPLAADTLSSAARLNSAQRATAPLPWVDRVAALEEAKRVAVEEEDYDKAEALKLDILAVLEGAYAKAKELRAEAADNSNWTASDHPPPETAPDSTAEVASAALPDANTGATKVAAEVAEAEKAAAQAEAALEAALAQKATAVSSARAAAEAAAERVAVLRREL